MTGRHEGTTWWRSTSEREFIRWLADRSTTSRPHLAPVLRTGRSSSGELVAEVLRPAGDPLSVALDRLGTPSVGVAVTLTVPLLELAVAATDGALLLGLADTDDVLVDDSGAVVLCDRPTGASAVPERPRRAMVLDGVEVLVLAVRVVWERVDAREPVRAAVDDAIGTARAGGSDALRALLEVVLAAAAPRPVRWEPAPADLVFAEPAVPREQPDGDLVRALRDLVERGVPLGRRRVPLRQVFVGVVVGVGAAAAALVALGS